MNWEQALNIATAGNTPTILVIDELPWLLEMDEAIEGLLQRVWDRVLRKRPVVLILIGSDLAMMDALTEYGRPLYDRTKILRLDPLTPSDVADLTGLGSADAVEAWALTGGFPNIVRSWPAGGTAIDFLSTQLPDASSPLVVSGERKVAAEFPADAFARPVLDAIGSGTREHGKIGQRSGLGGSSLERALAMLVDKRVVVRERPYSAQPSKLTHYRIEASPRNKVPPSLKYERLAEWPPSELIARRAPSPLAKDSVELWPTTGYAGIHAANYHQTF